MEEWEPYVHQRVVDERVDGRGNKGKVLDVTRFGHFADPYWRATVRWDDGNYETGIETSWLGPDDEGDGR